MANDNIIRFTKLSESLNTTLAKQIGILDKAATNLNTLNTSYGKLPSEYYKAVKNGLEIEKKKLQVDKELVTLEQKKTDLVKKSELAEKAKIQTKSAALRLAKQEATAKKQTTKLTLQEAEAQKKANREARQVAAIKNTTVGSLDNLKARLALVTTAWSKLTVKEIENTKRGKRLAESKKQLTAELLRLEKKTGDTRRQVGDYGKSLGKLRGSFINLASAMGVSLGLFGAFRLIKNSIGIVRDFEKQNATLAGVLQSTKEEISELTEDSKRLGSITVKTAGEVAGLQTEYARLGFTQQEILDLTEATIGGSVALNADLGETAQLVGAVVNSFNGLSATDAPMIMDVLSLATAKSALSFEKLQTALPIVSGAANAIGVPLTEVTATLGKLADAGIDASSGATALRNIYIESAKEGIDYKDALLQITKSTDKLKTANDLFGKRAAVSALIIANNTENVEELQGALNDAGGTFERMAENELNTLDGSLKLLTSAWEGFVLKMNDASDGGNALSKSIRFLAENLETIFKVVGVATTTFISYKVAVAASNLATKAGIIWTNGATVATNLRTIATNAGTAAQRAFNLAAKSNPLGLIVALLAAAVAAYYAFADSATAAQKAQKSFNEGREAAAKKEQERIKKEKEIHNERVDALREEIRLRKAKGEDVAKLDKEFINRKKDILDEEIANAQKIIDAEKNKVEALKARQKELQDIEDNRSGTRKSAKVKEESEANKAEITAINKQLGAISEIIEQRNQEIEDLNKIREQSENDLTVKIAELTTEQKKEYEKRLKELALFQRRLQDLQDEAIKDAEEREIAQTKTKFKREIEAIKGNSKVEKELRTALEESMLDEIIKISKKYREKEADLEKARLKEIEDLNKKSLDKRFDDLKKFVDELDRLKQDSDNFTKSFQTDVLSGAGLGSLGMFFDDSFDDLLKGSEDKWAVYFNGIAEAAQEAFNFIAQATQRNFDNDFALLEKRKENALRFTGESEAARAQIEEQFESRRRKIQEQQAKAQQQQAIFNTVINTAQGIVSTLAKTPPPAGLPFAAIMATIGATQIAMIKSQKLPQFKDGVRGFEGGHAIVGDGGVSEVIRTDKGVYSTPSKDTLVNLPKGADVFSSHDEYYNSVMSDLGVLPGVPKVEVNGGITKRDLDSVIGKHFSNIQINNLTLDERGYNKYQKKQNAKTNLLNKRINFKGISV